MVPLSFNGTKQTQQKMLCGDNQTNFVSHAMQTVVKLIAIFLRLGKNIFTHCLK